MPLNRTPVGTIQLGTFEPSEIPQWTSNAAGGRTVATDTTLFTTGTQAYRMNFTTGGQTIAKRARAFDIAKIAAGDTFSIDVYVEKAITGWLRFSFTNTLSSTANILRRSVVHANIIPGQWNTVTWLKSDMGAFGTWATDPRALGLQIDFNHTPSETQFIVFDNFKVNVTEARS